ncbi:MAG: CvpA family protein [Candidatus Omnitrophota bacterium]|jgi:uncharacterized membrane protein required for colicin V production
MGVIRQINWVDVFAIILFGRVCYIAVEKGFLSEIFKFFGTILTIYLSLHYYTALGDLLSGRLGIKFIPLEFLDFLCFIFLSLVGYLFFIVVRQLFSRLFQIKAVPYLSRWGGLALGIARGILMVGLGVFMLAISSVTYLRESAVNSYLGKRAIHIAPAVYGGIWNGLTSKFMPGEKFNQTVLEAQESQQKNQK